jgi:septal ring factor EnvC (AmiA/AmiB activator)
MKKWMYLIFPGTMLAGFLVFHGSYKKEAEAREAAFVAKLVAEKAETDRKKKEAEVKARDDAAKRQTERDDEERRKEADKVAKQAKDDQMVRDQIADFTKRASAARENVARLESELEQVRQEKERANRLNSDLLKRLESSHVARRTAELEIQTVAEVVMRRVADSSLVRPPPTPPAPPAPRS